MVAERALAWVRDHFEFDWTDDVLPLLFSHRAEIRDLAEQILRLDPVLHFERRPAFVRGTPAAAMDGGPPLARLFSAERLARLSRAVKGVPDEAFEQGLPRFAELPGSESLDSGIVFSGAKGRFRPRFRVLRERYFALRYPRQIAIVPSYACRSRCDFCFAKGLSVVYPRDMSLPDFRRILDEVGGGTTVRRIDFLGGEPTEFPLLGRFLDEVERRDMEFYFATNGLAEPKSFLKILARGRLTSVTIHVEEEEFYPKAGLDALRTNIAACGERDVFTILRTNLTRPAARNWAFLTDQAGRLQRGAVSFAVPFPSLAETNAHVPLPELKRYAPAIVGFAGALAPDRSGSRLSVVLAKPFPPCSFDLRELPALLRSVQYKNVCELDKNEGRYNACINPDGSVFPCMGLNSAAYRTPSMEAGSGWAVAHKGIAERLMTKPLMSECAGCRLHFLGVCQAACYAYL